MSETIAGFGPPEPSRIDFTPAEPAAPVVDFTPAAPVEPDPAAFVAYMASTSEMSPQDGAAALWQSSELGLDPRYTAENVKPLQQEHAQARLREQLARAPAVAEYMAQSLAHAALVKPDVPVLAMLGEALQLGFVDLGAALEGNRQAKQGLTSAEEQQLAFVEQVQGGGVAGADTLPRKVGAEIARASPTLAAFTSAALTGAAVGSLAGPIGAAAGGLVGAGIAAYTLNFGPLYRRLRGLTDDQGNALLTDEEAKTGAAAGSTLVAAVQTIPMAHFLRAVPGVNAALQKVGLDAATRATTSTVGRAALTRLAEYGGHVLAGGVATAGQAAANAATVELAKQQKGAEPDWSAVDRAAADGFISGLMLAPLAAFEPVRTFLHDVGRIHNARLEAFSLDAYAAMAKDLQVSKTNPAEAEALVAKLADQGNSPTVFVSPEGLSPEHMNELARAVGPDAMAEAAATQGDVPVPMGKYLTHLAEHHDALREDVKLAPDGATLREAAQIKPDAKAVLEALPEGERAKAELVLRPKAAPPPPPASTALRAVAEQMTEGKRLGDLAPGRRDLAAKNAERQALELATGAARTGTEAARQGFVGAGAQAAGSEQTPAAGKQNLREAGKKATRAEAALAEVAEFEGARDLNRALAKAESAALKEAETSRKFLLGYTKDALRAELGKAGQGYLEQVDRLLAGFELGQGASRTEVARRQATMQWLAEEQAAGRDPVIPDSVLAKLDRFVHWKELTPQEMRDLRDSVESIAHVAKLKNTLLEKQARVDRTRAMAQLVTALRDNTKETPFRPRGTVVERLQKALEGLKGLTYGLRAVERIVNVLDGGDIGGPWHRYVWDPINDSTNRWHDITRKTTDLIAKTLNEMPSADKQRWRETRFRAAGQQWDLTAAIAVALNSGNESNARKMLQGWQHDSVARRGLKVWDSDTPEEFLSKLTRADWQFVQTVWDRLEGMWPESAALEKRLTGLEPPKVKAKPFTRTLEDGSTIDLKGGYYPVIYDPDFSRQGAAGEEVSSVKLFDTNYQRAATPQGRLQARIEGFARPVLLTLDNLPGKISEAAKDIAMREALISVHSALTDDTMRAALHTSELARAGEKALIGWLRDTANDLVVPDNGAGPWFTIQNNTRSGYTASLFAYNLAQTWQNLTGIVPATKAVGPKWMASALIRYARERSTLTEWMKEQSPELRNEDKGGQILADAIREAAKGVGLTTGMMRFGINMFRATDLAIKYPTWLGDYMRSTALLEDGGRGLSHEEAVKQADATVRLNTMAMNTKDLPALLRNRVGRWMLPLYSYSMHRLNMFGDAIGAGQRLVSEHKTGTAAALIGGVWGTLAAEAVLSEIVKGNGPKDENDDGEVTAGDWAVWTAKVSATAPLTWLPFIGNAVRTAATGRDPLTTPEVAVFASVGRTARDAYMVAAAKLAGEEVDDMAVRRLALRLIETGGYLAAAASGGGGLPVSQIRATAGYLLDENSPKETPLQVGLGVAFGKKRPGKLLNLTE